MTEARFIQLVKYRRKWRIVATSNSASAFIDKPNSVVVRCHHRTGTKKILAEADKLWAKRKK